MMNKEYILLPTRKKNFIRPEAESLRKCFKKLMFQQFVLLLIDWNVYHGEFMSCFFDFMLLWLSFRNYMLLHKPTILVQIVVYLFAIIISVSHIQRLYYEY
jgi:hypothetical protein